jgi:hypothetical protein
VGIVIGALNCGSGDERVFPSEDLDKEFSLLATRNPEVLVDFTDEFINSVKSGLCSLFSSSDSDTLEAVLSS